MCQSDANMQYCPHSWNLTCWLWCQSTRRLSWQYRVRHTACTNGNIRCVLQGLIVISLRCPVCRLAPNVRLCGAGILQNCSGQLTRGGAGGRVARVGAQITREDVWARARAVHWRAVQICSQDVSRLCSRLRFDMHEEGWHAHEQVARSLRVLAQGAACIVRGRGCACSAKCGAARSCLVSEVHQASVPECCRVGTRTREGEGQPHGVEAQQLHAPHHIDQVQRQRICSLRWHCRIHTGGVGMSTQHRLAICMLNSRC